MQKTHIISESKLKLSTLKISKNKSNIVHKILCSNCISYYIDLTMQSFENRFNEHEYYNEVTILNTHSRQRP